MQSRSKARSMNVLSSVLQPQAYLIHTEPNDIYSAMQLTHWANAVKEELNALTLNNTWCLTTVPSGRVPIGCK